MERPPREVLIAYPEACRPRRIEFLDWAGGFSGALLWKLETPSGAFCLRRWPRAHPTEDRLRFIHAVQHWASARGCSFVPVPSPTRDGESYVRHGGFLWELATWMPGSADYRRRPSVGKLQAAMRAMAQVHMALATFPPPEPARVLAVSPGIVERRRRLAEWAGRDLGELSDSLPSIGCPELDRLMRHVLDMVPAALPGLDCLLAHAERQVVPLQPCLCDVWHEHVLYLEDRVAGLVDFGAARFENVAADIARLLGSMVLDDAQGWVAGMEAYGAIRPLSHAEIDLIEAFDRSTVVLSGLNWTDWIYLQQREFPSHAAVLDRLQEIAQRLESVVAGDGVHPVRRYRPEPGFHHALQFP
ncbi:MAG: phosphotransferase [Thermoguttaceae bacterium]|jgi:Ser/Thr protein kinase RdoA (MazF antagonist)|nr:phosphotransferase [Thermoguttaceae bacterium]